MKEMKGVCFLHSETGTEGGWWAMLDERLVPPDGRWGYDALHLLEEGDDFTVYAEDGSVLYHGIIQKDTETGLTPRQALRDGRLVDHSGWKQQAVGGMWVHWLQKGIAPEKWAELFVGDKRCVLRREAED